MVFDVEIVSEVVACMHVRYFPLHQSVHVLHRTYPLGTHILRFLRIPIGDWNPSIKNIYIKLSSNITIVRLEL